jgi:hypothetical protein
MRCFLGILCFGMALLAGTVSQAAIIEPVQGKLSLNQGQGFQKVNSRIEANVGDSVMVSPKGSATVSYPDGCKVDVQPGTVMTIAPLSPCASGSYAADQSRGNVYVIGAGIAAALGFGIYEIVQSSHSGSNPASP